MLLFSKPVPQRVGQGGSPERPTSRFLVSSERLVKSDPIAGRKKREVGRCPNTLGNHFTRPLSREIEEPGALTPTYHVCRGSFEEARALRPLSKPIRWNACPLPLCVPGESGCRGQLQARQPCEAAYQESAFADLFRRKKSSTGKDPLFAPVASSTFPVSHDARAVKRSPGRGFERGHRALTQPHAREETA